MRLENGRLAADPAILYAVTIAPFLPDRKESEPETLSTVSPCRLFVLRESLTGASTSSIPAHPIGCVQDSTVVFMNFRGPQAHPRQG
jgi:hypothetical protein